MTGTTIGFLYPGAMGASLARTLSQRQPHLTLLTSVGDRSTSTRERAKSAGLVDVHLKELVARSEIIISILPPSAALDLAREIVDLLPSSDRSAGPPIFVDANAVSPGTMTELEGILQPAGVPLIDGCVIGGPAREGYDPKIYLSSAPEHDAQLKEVADVLSGGEKGKGLKVEVMEGAGQGAASALKMAYGGINKGATGLAAIMILAAHAHSPETASALLHELGQSALGKLAAFSRSIPDMLPKAYRFVGEMEENAAFIRSALGPHDDSDDASKAAETYQGLANVFQRIADDIRIKDGTKGEATSKRGGEVGVLLDWAEQGRKLLSDNKS